MTWMQFPASRFDVFGIQMSELVAVDLFRLPLAATRELVVRGRLFRREKHLEVYAK